MSSQSLAPPRSALRAFGHALFGGPMLRLPGAGTREARRLRTAIGASAAFHGALLAGGTLLTASGALQGGGTVAGIEIVIDTRGLETGPMPDRSYAPPPEFAEQAPVAPEAPLTRADDTQVADSLIDPITPPAENTIGEAEVLPARLDAAVLPEASVNPAAPPEIEPDAPEPPQAAAADQVTIVPESPAFRPDQLATPRELEATATPSPPDAVAQVADAPLPQDMATPVPPTLSEAPTPPPPFEPAPVSPPIVPPSPPDAVAEAPLPPDMASPVPPVLADAPIPPTPFDPSPATALQDVIDTQPLITEPIVESPSLIDRLLAEAEPTVPEPLADQRPPPLVRTLPAPGQQIADAQIAALSAPPIPPSVALPPEQPTPEQRPELPVGPVDWQQPFAPPRLDPRLPDAESTLQNGGADGLNSAIDAILSEITCGALSANVGDDGGLAIRGFVTSSSEQDSVRARLLALEPVTTVVDEQVVVVGNLLCDGLAVYGAGTADTAPDQQPLANLPPALRQPPIFGMQQGAHGTFAENDYLEVYVETPDYPAYVYIDFFRADGTVAHLMPSEIAPVNYFPEPITMIPISASEPGGISVPAGPPFGMGMVVTLSSNIPLFHGIASREPVEVAEAYLRELDVLLREREIDPEFRTQYGYVFIEASRIE